MEQEKFGIVFLLVTFFLNSHVAQASPLNIDCEGVHISQANDFKSLIEPISLIYQRDKNGNVIKDDTREMLKNLKGPHVDEAFKRRIRTNDGFVFCETGDPDNPMKSATGSLYYAANQLYTALHAIRYNGSVLSKCWFMNREYPAQKVELDMTSAGIHAFTNQDTLVDVSHDLVAIRLKKPIKGARPFPFDPVSSHNGESLLMISAHHEGAPARLNISEPIAQFCHSQDVYPRSAGIGPIINSDCTSKGGASGATLYAFRNGRWAKVGMNLGSRGGKEKDGQAYSIENDVFTQGIGFDPQSQKELERFALGS